MGLGLGNMIGMMLRKSPVARIRSAQRRAAEAGIDLTLVQLEQQSLAGADIDALVTASIRARELGIDAPWIELTSIGLAGRDVVAVIESAAQSRTVAFDTIGPDSKEAIIGNCRDGTAVRAHLRLEYCPSPAAIAFNIAINARLQEALAVRALVLISKSSSLESLLRQLPNCRSMLQLFAQEREAGVRHLEVDFAAA